MVIYIPWCSSVSHAVCKAYIDFWAYDVNLHNAAFVFCVWLHCSLHLFILPCLHISFLALLHFYIIYKLQNLHCFKVWIPEVRSLFVTINVVAEWFLLVLSCFFFCINLLEKLCVVFFWKSFCLIQLQCDWVCCTFKQFLN